MGLVRGGIYTTAIETFATDHNGTYVGATLAELQKTEPTLNDTTTAVAQEPSGLSATGYTIESEAKASKDVFKLVNAGGALTRKVHVCRNADRDGDDGDDGSRNN